MTYDAQEQGVATGEPVELYDFIDNATGDHWRICTAEDTVTYGVNDYAPGVIDRETIVRAGSLREDELQIHLERGHPLAAMYLSGTPEGLVGVTIYRGHLSDGNYIMIWSGFVAACEFDGNGVPTLRCIPRGSFNAGAGKRRRCSRVCDHMVFEYGCNLNAEAFRVEGVISNISGTTITSSAFSAYSDGHFAGGKIIIEERYTRFIKSHTTNTIVINRGCGAAISDSFRAYPGCDGLPTTCNTKFSNKPNFGGEEFWPDKNPFEKGIDTYDVTTGMLIA